MINDREFLHGAAFFRLINYGEEIVIAHPCWIHSSIYLIESNSSKSAILFKVSTKPKSAWSFTFSTQEESALDILYKKYPNFTVFIALVCHKDGICCIAEQRLWSILDKNSGIGGQYISVSRQPHGSYHVNGPGRQQMEQTVPQNDWPRVVFATRENSYE